MADQLFLSYWVRGFHTLNMLRAWEKMLRQFPFSKLARWPPTLRVHAVAYEEPLLREQAFENPLNLDAVLDTAKEVLSEDCAYVLDAYWDIWQYDGSDWKVAPSRVALACFGAGFESEKEENLRVEFGPDANFLPQPEFPQSAHFAQSNLKSLLHLAHQMDNALPVERRQLWTESGENFAARLADYSNIPSNRTELK